jgi:DNA-binding transcriptional MerR regulator
MHIIKSRDAASQLGVRYHRLYHLLMCGYIPHPTKDSSGHYVWTEADLARARAALAKIQRPRREEVASAQS